LSYDPKAASETPHEIRARQTFFLTGNTAGEKMSSPSSYPQHLVWGFCLAQ